MDFIWNPATFGLLRGGIGYISAVITGLVNPFQALVSGICHGVFTNLTGESHNSLVKLGKDYRMELKSTQDPDFQNVKKMTIDFFKKNRNELSRGISKSLSISILSTIAGIGATYLSLMALGTPITFKAAVILWAFGAIVPPVLCVAVVLVTLPIFCCCCAIPIICFIAARKAEVQKQNSLGLDF